MSEYHEDEKIRGIGFAIVWSMIFGFCVFFWVGVYLAVRHFL